MINLRLLEIFRAVMQCRTTIGAARSLQISQPAVSSALRNLETQLDFCLFDRVGNRLLPRNEAKVLYEASDSLFLLTRSFYQTAEDLKEDRVGHLRIVTTPQLSHSILPRAIQQLLQDRPKVKVFFDVRRSYAVIDDVETGTADIGFATALETNLNYSLEIEKIATSSLFCVVPDQHPLAQHQKLSPLDLSKHPLIGLDMNTRIYPLIRDAFGKMNVPYNTVVETRYSTTACILATEGVGIAVVDGFSAIAYVRNNRGVKLIPFHPKINVDAFILFPKHQQPSRLAQILASAIRSCTDQFLVEAME